MDQLDHLGWVDHRNYRIWTDRFQIRTTSARFAEWLDYALADYGLRRTAPTRYSIVIEDDGHDGRPGHRFHLLYRGARQIVRSLSVGTVARMLMGELEATLFPRRSDAIYLQTALLRSGGHAALLPAPFLTWIGGLGRGVGRAGIILPDTKTVAVDRSSAEVIPTAPELNVPGDAAGRLDDLFRPGEGPGERAPVDRRLPIDVVYTVVSEDHPAVSTASRAFTLQRLASSLINTRLMGEGTLRTLASLVERARCYQIAYGEPRVMLEAIAGSMAG